MSQPVPDQDERSKMRKFQNGNMDESIKGRLPRANAQNAPAFQQRIVPVQPPPEPEPRRARLKFMPAFWTVASVLSLTVNLVLIIIVLLLYQMLSRIQVTADDQVTKLLGGLYTNFVKMDEANIRTNIHVEKEIPVQFSLNVRGPTNVTFSQDVTIGGPLVTVPTGG